MNAGRNTADLLFVCWGNICRSAMAEQIGRSYLSDHGLDLVVDSAGISDEEHGNPMDRRAVRCLRDHGYPLGDHRARQVDADDAQAGLIVAMEDFHIKRLVQLGFSPENTRLISDFIPGQEGTDLPDPWYGGPEGFEHTASIIEQAMPGIAKALSN